MYDIYSILEHHYFKIEKRKNPKFVVIEYFETLQKYLPLPEGTRAGLNKTYLNKRGIRVRSTVLVNTLRDVAKIQKILSSPIDAKKLSKADYGPSKHSGPRPVEVASIVKAAPEFIQPYPQESLNGEPGLTSADIARSLGVKHKHVLEKIRRIDQDKIKAIGLVLAVNTAHEYSLNTETAKFFVAKWDNHLGWGYLKYLLSCENIVGNSLAVGPTISENQIANIIAMTTAIMNRMIPQQVETTIRTEIVKIEPKIQRNTERHDEAMLSASQQAICQPLYNYQNFNHECSIIHSLIKKALKLEFLSDTPASDCTWHKIAQRHFEAVVDRIKNYNLSDFDKKRIEKFRATPAGIKDQAMWARRRGEYELLHS